MFFRNWCGMQNCCTQKNMNCCDRRECDFGNRDEKDHDYDKIYNEDYRDNQEYKNNSDKENEISFDRLENCTSCRHVKCYCDDYEYRHCNYGKHEDKKEDKCEDKKEDKKEEKCCCRIEVKCDCCGKKNEKQEDEKCNKENRRYNSDIKEKEEDKFDHSNNGCRNDCCCNCFRRCR